MDKFIIFPPEGFEFRECKKCGNFFVYHGKSVNCLWCDMNMDEDIIDKEEVDG
jgi:prepilin-type processing-associated H-X9-DG protein